VLITPNAERTMLTSLSASKEFSLEHLDEELIAQSEWLYLEGYKFSETAGAESVRKSIEIAKKNNTKIAITASDVFIIEFFNEQFMSALKQADLVFCNENEAKLIAKCENSDEAIKIIGKFCPNVAMTKGKDGSKILFNDRYYNFPAFPAFPLTDTTGAGDMFAGAFLYGLMNYEKIVEDGVFNIPKRTNDNEFDKIYFAGRLASKAAATIVTQLGARYDGNLKMIIPLIS
jgi:sugar/nucleoside kinase (ribokinase family)